MLKCFPHVAWVPCILVSYLKKVAEGPLFFAVAGVSITFCYGLFGCELDRKNPKLAWPNPVNGFSFSFLNNKKNKNYFEKRSYKEEKSFVGAFFFHQTFRLIP